MKRAVATILLCGLLAPACGSRARSASSSSSATSASVSVSGAPVAPAPIADAASNGDERLFALDLPNAERQRLTRESAERARTFPRAAARAWLSETDPTSAEAERAFLTRSGDSAIVPLLELPASSDAARSLEALRSITDAELALRKNIEQRLQAALADHRILPEPPLVREIKPPPRRVADEAYLGLQRLRSFRIPAADRIAARDAYYALSLAERDNLLTLAQRTGDLPPPRRPSTSTKSGRPSLLQGR